MKGWKTRASRNSMKVPWSFRIVSHPFLATFVSVDCYSWCCLYACLMQTVFVDEIGEINTPSPEIAPSPDVETPSSGATIRRR